MVGFVLGVCIALICFGIYRLAVHFRNKRKSKQEKDNSIIDLDTFNKDVSNKNGKEE